MTIKAALIALPLLVLGWLSTLAVVALLTDEAPAYVVLLPSQSFLQNLPENIAVMGWSEVSITVASNTDAFAKSLYQSGARLVLPAGLPGCLPLPKSL